MGKKDKKAGTNDRGLPVITFILGMMVGVGVLFAFQRVEEEWQRSAAEAVPLGYRPVSLPGSTPMEVRWGQIGWDEEDGFVLEGGCEEPPFAFVFRFRTGEPIADVVEGESVTILKDATVEVSPPPGEPMMPGEPMEPSGPAPAVGPKPASGPADNQ